MLDIKLEVSKKYDKYNKKYDAIIDDGEKITRVSFGDNRFEDFTFHKDEERKKLYIGRRSNMEKKYLDDPYAPAFYAMNILWNKPTISKSIKDTNKRYKNINIHI